MTFNWWQTLLAGILIFATGFGVRHFTYDCPKPIIAISEVSQGIPDTSKLPAVRPLSGQSGSISVGAHNPTTGVELSKTSDSTRVAIHVDLYYEKETDSTLADSSHFYLNSKTYPYVDNDTLKAYIIHEWEFQAAPPMIIERTDTIRVPLEIEVPAEVSFFEKPVVVAIGAVIIFEGLRRTFELIFDKK